jgi:chromosome segregation ATPase
VQREQGGSTIDDVQPTDLTIQILREIRDEQRATRIELKSEIGSVRGELGSVRSELAAMNSNFSQRFEVIETTLRDLAEQMVMMGRGLKTALASRTAFERRIEDHERRLVQIEKRRGH